MSAGSSKLLAALQEVNRAVERFPEEAPLHTECKACLDSLGLLQKYAPITEGSD